MLVVLDQHNAVAHRYPKHSEQTGKGGEREDIAAREGSQHSTSQSERQREEGQSRQTPVPESSLQEQNDAERSSDLEAKQASLSSLLIFVHPKHPRMILKRELDPLKPLFH